MYLVDSILLSFIRKGVTCNVLRVDVGVLGMLKATQKSSAKRLDRKPFLVMGVESDTFGVCVLCLPFSSCGGVWCRLVSACGGWGR